MEFLLFFMFLSFVVIAWILFLCNFADKNNCPKKAVFWMFVVYIIYKGVFYLIVAGGVFFVVSAQANSFLLGLSCALPLLIILPTVKVVSVISEGFEELRMVKNMIFSEIDVDYFHMSENSIALNVKIQEFAWLLKILMERFILKIFLLKRLKMLRPFKQAVCK